MGTTAEKLNHLKQTKEEIKTAIKNKGVTVADTDTFRSYADKIDDIVVSKTQAKTLSVTENKTYTVTPDTASGYNGLSDVTVTANVSGGKLGGNFQYNHYNTSASNSDQTYNITIPANKQYAIIVFVINSQNNTPAGSLEVTSQPSNITLSAIGSSNGHREHGNVNITTYCYLATKTSSISSAATITFKNDWSDTHNGYGNAGCSYGVFYNV